MQSGKSNNNNTQRENIRLRSELRHRRFAFMESYELLRREKIVFKVLDIRLVAKKLNTRKRIEGIE